MPVKSGDKSSKSSNDKSEKSEKAENLEKSEKSEKSNETFNEKSNEEGTVGKMSDALKKIFTTGVTAAFMTEESILSYLSELKLPKEILNLVLQGAQKSKDEIANRVSREINQRLSKIDFIQEFSKFAETHKFRITAEVDIVPKKSADTP